MNEFLLDAIPQLIPKLTHPLSLIAFSIFVFLYLFVKILVNGRLFPQFTQKNAFKFLNKLLNIAAIVILLIIILGFASNLYVNYRSSVIELHKERQLKQKISELKIFANECRNNLTGTSQIKRLYSFQPYIYDIGNMLPIGEAYTLVKKLGEEYDIPELTPALLVVSKEVMDGLIERPFNYVLSDKEISGYRPTYGWCLSDALVSEDLSIPLDKARFLAAKDCKYRDLLLFLSGDFDLLINDYPTSIWIDAAFYARARAALLEKRYLLCSTLVDEFIDKYPQHRHVDDAYVLKVVALELEHRPVEALYSTFNGVGRGDGDMTDWLISERFDIIERMMNTEELKKLILAPMFSNMIPMLRYTLANHLMAEQKYYDAQLVFCNMQEGIERSIYDMPVDINLSTDISLSTDLMGLTKDKSPTGLFQLANYIFDTELIHFNQFYKIFRPRRNGGLIEARTPEEYYNKHNNFYIASQIYDDIIQKTNDLVLKQKAYYKMGRCFDHLSRSCAFYYESIGGATREQYAQKCIEAFLEGYKIFQTGLLADDCLAEVGVLYHLQFQNENRSIYYLERVVNEFPGSNAMDNALYWLAHIYEDRGEKQRAEKLYTQIFLTTPKQKWQKLAGEHLQKKQNIFYKNVP